MKAYKVFNNDWTCRNFKYEIGKTYKLEDSKGNLIEPSMCNKGFHACLKVSDCFSYYSFNPENKIAEVELSGTILGIEEDKQCSNIITIVKELTWSEMLILANSGHSNSGHSNSGNWNSGHSNSGDWNSGHRNSGNWNSGHRNSGHRNSGNWNSGNWNSGHRNSGNWNSGNWNSGNWNSGHSNSGNWNSGHSNSGNWNSGHRNSGFFNSKTPKSINVFNKKCDINVWENAEKPEFIYNINTNIWIYFSEMTDEEKIKYPKAYVCDGYLKSISYKEAWEKSYSKSTKEDINLLKALPNFNSKVFEEITGIKI